MKKNLKYVILPVIVMIMSLFICTFKAQGFDGISDKNVTVYGYEDGLNSSKGNCIAETADGYIWIGQYAGLTFYNGKKFTTVAASDGCDLNGVISLLAMGNTLYIGTQNDFFIYENYKYRKVDVTGESGYVSVNGISSYQGIVYLATSKGLYSYRDGEVSSLVADTNFIDVTSGDIGIYAVTNDNSVYSLNTGSSFYNNNDIKIKSVKIVNDELYMGSAGGELVIYSKGKFTTYSVASQSLNNFYYNEDTLFIASDDGTYTFDGTKASRIEGLSADSSVEDVFCDYQGNLWIVSSASDGILKITDNAFDNLFTRFDVSDFLYSHTEKKITSTGVNAITRYHDLTYVATESALLVFDEENETIIDNALVDYLMNVRIRDLSVYQDKLYIASYDSSYALVVYDGTNISNVTADDLLAEGDEANSKAGQLRCFTKGSDSLYIGSNYGISRLCGDSIKTVKPENRPLYLYYKNDVLYACIQNEGIYMYDSELNYIGIVPGTEGRTVLKCLYENDTFIYSTNGSLYISDLKNESQAVNFSVLGSIVDLAFLNGKYYIGTDSDIYVITKDAIASEEVSYTVLGRSEGLTEGLSSNASGMYDEESGRYYFAGSDAVYVYDLNYNTKEKPEAKIAISSISVDGVTYSPSSISLRESAKRLTVYFDILDYTGTNSFTVYYKLTGSDSDYITEDYDSLQSITYTNLKGGKYTLEIYAVDANGTKTLNTISMEISKEYSFLEHSWAIALIIILGILFVGAIVALSIFITLKRARKRQEELRNITIESIEAIASTIDAKDKYTNGHSMRVGMYSKIIARELGMSKEDCQNIYYTGLLHDIGKIAVPRAILNKPGRLTDEEFEVIKTHTTEGAKILSSISTIPHIQEGAKYHHEKYNGTGYPEGLAGEKIPYIARIICCADCFDAMNTKRSYKEPYSPEHIISEFERCSGTQFDPKIAESVIKLIKEGRLSILDDIH